MVNIKRISLFIWISLAHGAISAGIIYCSRLAIYQLINYCRKLHYRSYELNAEITEPLTLADYMHERFGDKASANEWMQIVTQAGLNSGIDVDFDNIGYVFNTRYLHRMLQALQNRERQLHHFLDTAFYHIILQGRVLDNRRSH